MEVSPNRSLNASHGAAAPQGDAASVVPDFEELISDSNFYRAVLDAMAEGLVVQGRDGRILVANNAAARILELSMEQLLGRDSFDPRWRALREDGSELRGEDHPAIVCLRTGAPVENVLMIVESGLGRRKFISVNSRPHFDESGRVDRAVTTFVDVTEFKRTVARLEESQARTAAATQAGRVGLWDWDIARNELTWDESMFALYGRQRSDFASAYEAWLSCVHPDDAAAADAAVKRCLERRSQFAAAFRILRPDGSVRHLEAAAHIVFDARGKPERLLGTNIDITDRIVFEQALAEKEARFRGLVEISPVPMAGNDSRMNITFLNPAFVRLFGYTLADIPTVDHWWPLAYPDEAYRRWVQESWMGELAAIKTTGRDFAPLQIRIRCKNGDCREVLAWASQTVGTLEDEHLVIFADITERITAEQRLRESEAKFRAYVEHAPVGLFVADEHGAFVQTNAAAAAMTGFPEEVLLTMGIAEISGPSAPAAMRHFQEVTATGHAAGELSFLKQDGRTGYWHVEAVRLSETRFLAFMIDTTARRQELDELHTLESAVQQSANIVAITDPSGIIEFVNGAFEAGTGYAAAEVMGRTPRLLRSGRHPESFYDDMWNTIREGRIWRGQIENRRKDGSRYWASTTISPIFNAQGEIRHFVAVQEDITARIALETQLKGALAEARQAAQAKSEFLAVMSHELRTPLNGVLGFAEILRDTPLVEEQRECVEQITASGQHLLAIVNDILDFSSLEKGRLCLDYAPATLESLLESACGPCRKAAADKGLSLAVEIAPDVPPTINTDARRLRQILLNLVGNAVKFTAHGSVTLGVRPPAGTGELEFFVTDTGPGMPPPVVERLFLPFTQADSTLRRSHEGTGLGLAISKRLAEAMGGTIVVESTPGVGSTFRVHLPLGGTVEPTETSPAPGPTAVPRRGKGPVLLVEDDRVSARLTTRMLDALGHETTLAQNGQEALDQFIPGGFSLILMDVQMPMMDGITSAARIRAMEAAAAVAPVPIVALTANVMPGDRERCMQAGMNDYLTKPLTRAALAAKIAEFLPASAG